MQEYYCRSCKKTHENYLYTGRCERCRSTKIKKLSSKVELTTMSEHTFWEEGEKTARRLEKNRNEDGSTYRPVEPDNVKQYTI